VRKLGSFITKTQNQTEEQEKVRDKIKRGRKTEMKQRNNLPQQKNDLKTKHKTKDLKRKGVS
jgi:hypothetical protein